MSPSQDQILEIERRFDDLPPQDKLALVSRLVQRVKHLGVAAWDDDLAAMARDPEVQRELRLIDAEFRQTEMDGLCQ